MSRRFQVTFDCHDLTGMIRFWAIALSYQEQPPPAGHESWAAWATERNILPQDWRGALIDPGGTGPRVFFQPVPEANTAKNRLHLDVTVTRPEAPSAERREHIDAHVTRWARSEVPGSGTDTYDCPTIHCADC